MVFHRRLSGSKSPQVSKTLLSILAVFNNAVVWMASTRPPTSKSSRPFNNPLVTVPKAPITIGIIVTFMFHSFFNSLARSRYLSLFSHSLLLLSLLYELKYFSKWVIGLGFYWSRSFLSNILFKKCSMNAFTIKMHWIWFLQWKCSPNGLWFLQ